MTNNNSAAKNRNFVKRLAVKKSATRGQDFYLIYCSFFIFNTFGYYYGRSRNGRTTF